jgi:hypothetical protein
MSATAGPVVAATTTDPDGAALDCRINAVARRVDLYLFRADRDECMGDAQHLDWLPPDLTPLLQRTEERVRELGLYTAPEVGRSIDRETFCSLTNALKEKLRPDLQTIEEYAQRWEEYAQRWEQYQQHLQARRRDGCAQSLRRRRPKLTMTDRGFPSRSKMNWAGSAG